MGDERGEAPGLLQQVQTIIMKYRLTGRARGFGFVVFSDPSIVDITFQEKTHHGR
jgi:RNA recognition motif-containing protein